MSTVKFVQEAASGALLWEKHTLAIVGKVAALKSFEGAVSGALGSVSWSDVVGQLKPSELTGASITHVVNQGSCKKIIVGAVSDVASRDNAPSRPDIVRELVAPLETSENDVTVVCALEDKSQAFPYGCAVARAFHLYSTKSNRTFPATVTVAFHVSDGGSVDDLAKIQNTADGIRLAARLVDTFPEEMNVNQMIEEARAVATEVGVSAPEVIQGEELKSRGFGAIYGVGKGATEPPALCILRHRPSGAKENIVWVGKGIVFDTGGLSIKGKDFMPGMKTDMGGSAALLGAFKAIVKCGFEQNLTLILCLADNAVGPKAQRPDDIVVSYSGKSIEINNTDAEGRLVLADGISYAVKHEKPDIICDMATLTGAQAVTTGQKVASIYCNNLDIEGRFRKAGLSSGDLCFPLLYIPEFHRAEFKSEVADMRNSVANRSNAQCSCASQFIANHLCDYEKQWIHIDMAAPSHIKFRATGFGVALMVESFLS